MIKQKTPKSPKYLKYVRTLPCVVTGKSPVEAHHLIGHHEGGMGMKSSDYYAIPLSPEIHRELHDHGWRTWEDRYGSQWRYVAATLQQAIMENVIKERVL